MLTFCFIITWWRYQMETFSALLALCVGNYAVTGEFPTQRPATRSFGVFFDLRRHYAHYVVTVMNTWWNVVMHLSVFFLYAWLALRAYYDDFNAHEAKNVGVGKNLLVPVMMFPEIYEQGFVCFVVDASSIVNVFMTCIYWYLPWCFHSQ